MMHALDHTPHTKKQTAEPIVASHTTNIVLRTNYKFVKPQNGPTLHEHVVQGLHIIVGMVLPILTHLSTPIIKNYLPIKTISPYGQPNPTPWMSIPLKPHLPIDMP
jgi:hypothetical protein